MVGKVKGQKDNKPRETSHGKAGLKFPVSRIGKMMRRDRLSKTMGKGAQVVMTAVMEYVASEILELAGSVALESNKKRIAPRHLMLAISGDEELSKICCTAIFSQSGTTVKIHPRLNPNAMKKGGKKGDTSQVNPTQEI